MPLSVLSILGDAFWIVATAMIASATRGVWRALPADARLPMQWGLNGKVGWRARKAPALGLALGFAIVFGLVLSALARAPQFAPDELLILFLVRAATAPLFILVHMLWLRGVLRTLAAEGVLKP
ncbi:hypothetical protein [Phenylobacterium kunshanense]|uniref:DUF1648 domain-containing protein n=1 Tax=Phenylobacterium kunshanense TaxID=1445034 RepID=A0A328BIH3_9CAUL|nr:hypothetical protein [Phenylobacterium kunshanense]RAK67282.1 hypothetical protein DJ019_04960 [Phenylobacterium kunshanense]